tara:strand:+ start:9307 stop:10434 length:1128 start_codon:yes stop_codon:yes gene_type:complete
MNNTGGQHIQDEISTSLALLINSKNIVSHEILQASYDYSEVYQSAIKNGVVGLIHQNAHNLIEIPLLVEQINNYYKNYKVLNSFIDHEATNVLIELQKKHIDVVVLKGFSLAKQVYSEPAIRPKTDIDIIIKENDSEKVKEFFLSRGYINPRGWEPKAIINQFSYKKELGKGINVYFDIHLKISNSKPIENILNYNELLKTANTEAITGINLVNKPYALIHAAFHLLGHKSAGDMVKLIWYYDIHLLLKTLTENDKEALLTIIQKTGLANIISHTLNLTTQFFASTQATDLLHKVKGIPFDSNYDYLLGNSSGVKGLLLTLKATKGLREKVDVIKETVLPPAAEIYVKYGKNTKWPLSILYLRRLISGTVKHLKK